MPVQIDFGKPPVGYAVSSARAADEKVSVQFLEFTSTEDGQHFIRRLEGFPSEVLKLAASAISPSQVDNMLAIVHRDGKATAYINELTLHATVRPSRPIELGAGVTKSDVADIDRLEVGVNIPKDSGVLFVFSAGWRKGMFYDFGPIGGPNPQPRDYDLEAMFGQAYCQVLFQERFGISDAEWSTLLATKWFPFAGLSEKSVDSLLSHIRSGWNPDELIGDLVAEVKARLPVMLEYWRRHVSLAPHIQILECAVERFQNDDFVSCTGLLFPRIEGILRTHHTSLGISSGPSPANLTNSAVAAKLNKTMCLLMPHRFATYLREVYFANFNPIAQDIDVSRHSVAHGVASVTCFNSKSALLGMLVVNQLFHFLKE